MKGKAMENKALAILDMAIKISENTPVDILVWYYGLTGTLELRIFWKGIEVSADDHTDYTVPRNREPSPPNEITADDMLRVLEEIWAGRNG